MSEDFFQKSSFDGRDDRQENRQGYSTNRPAYNSNGRNFRSEYRQGDRPFNKYNNNPNEPRAGRTPRPRFNREVPQQGGYTPNSYSQRPRPNREGGYEQAPRPFRPRTEQTQYRPYGSQGQQGTPYGNRSSYGDNRNQGYGNRNSYGDNRPSYGEGRPSYGDNRNQPYGERQGYSNHRPYQQQRPTPKAKRPNPGKVRIDYKEVILDPTAPLRLNKFLANAGVCSRRDADKYINAGVVTVNGNVVTELGTKIYRTDEIRFHGELVRLEKKVYVLLNKPKGYVTTSDDPQNRKTVMDLVHNACPERIYPVGRLDRNTTGVLLLTNDGELASKLTHPKFLKKKIYHVYLDQNVTAAHMREIAEGIVLEDGEIKADQVEYASPTDKKQVGIEIHSGRNRIVRRIFESLGYHVTKLDRVYFAGLTKKNLKRGDWRYLTEQEVNMLRMGAFE